MARTTHWILLALSMIVAVLLVTGCVSQPGPGTPTPTPTLTATPTATPTATTTVTPTPTPTSSPTAAATATPTATSTPAPTPTSTTASVNITAQNFAFSTDTITVPRGALVTVTFVNRDQGIPHNVAFYTTSAATATIYKGQITSGSTPLIYTFTAPSTPGNYFFRCDVHPDMNGVFVVT